MFPRITETPEEAAKRIGDECGKRIGELIVDHLHLNPKVKALQERLEAAERCVEVLRFLCKQNLPLALEGYAARQGFDVESALTTYDKLKGNVDG